ncbi:hypothetical protein AYO44_15635 [Planctomycetaceae bacterium SCGC AG-212-F19]|nr:hypothetical protein AYO44_15635 [Planctomycetaceae bacterium SCGC AG-212-F19]
MHARPLFKGAAVIGVCAGLVTAGFVTRGWWLPALFPEGSSVRTEKQDHGPVAEVQQVRLSPQAQANLRLVVQPLAADIYWRTIELPGTVVDRPAHSDRGVVSPATAVITKVHAFPGDTVRPGDPLFTLRLLSETLHLTQSELFKTSKEIQITQEQQKRLSDPAVARAVPEAKVIEIDNQLRRLSVAAQAYRTELLTRGLTPTQIDGVAQGKYVSEIQVTAPQRSQDSKVLVALGNSAPPSPDAAVPLSFEVQELKVDLGQQVQAGQTVALLSNHQALYIEGRGFRQETPLVEKAARDGLPVQVEFMEDAGGTWPALEQNFTIRHIGNTIDPASRTFAFFLPLNNQARTFDKDGKTLLLWRFRPGQKVRLHIRVEKLENVFVLPADAVVREGPEAFVFRQNGDFFDRKPVHIVYQDRRHVVIANDGSVPPGLFVAQNGAAQLNRVLKSQSGSLPPGFHMHADGTIHSNSAH